MLTQPLIDMAMVPALSEIAFKARKILESILAHSEITSTKGTCLYACLLLAGMLNRYGYPTQIRGGDGENDGGLITPFARHGHYWCETTSNEVIYIVDVTADQFGFDKVVLKQVSTLSWPRYIPGCQDTVDLHVSMNIESQVLQKETR